MTPIDDDELRSMLEARGDRHAIDLRAVAARARQDAIAAPRGRRRTVGFRAALAGLGSVAAVALVLVLALVPLSLRPTASAEPSAAAPSEGSSPTPAAPTPSDEIEPAPVEALTPQDLADWLAAAGPDAVGRVVLLDGELIRDPSVDCFGVTNALDCVPIVVRAAPFSIVVEPVGDIGPGPWDGSAPVSGILALRATDRTWEGTTPVMEFLGVVQTGNPRSCGKAADCRDRPGWTVSDLISLDPPDGPDWFLVVGWLVRTSAHPCPSPADPYSCPTSDVLTPERIQPTGADGSSELPAGALRLPSGAYDQFALSPEREGEGVVPRAGAYLVQRVLVPPCGRNEDCFVGPEHRRWVMHARVDPIAATSSPSPTQAPDTDHYPGGVPRMIQGEPVLIGLDAQANARDVSDDTPFLVGGWFDSHILNVCSGGPGNDPNPLASRACPRYTVDGLPGRPFYPDGTVLPDGDGAIVLRVHTHDPSAETCDADTIDECRRRVVVEGVAWFGADVMPVGPLGPREAISRATGVFVMEWRPEGAASQTAIEDDVFTVPIACPSPWPTLVFSIHGDPRYGLVAVFPETAAREAFQAATAPEAAGDCLASPIGRPADPRWVSHENVLALTYGDAAFAERLALELVGHDPGRPALPMTEPEVDRGLETVTDYLLARSSGQLDHAWGERLGDEDYLGWTEDVFRRYAADALVGRIEALDDEPTVARVGAAGAAAVRDPGVARARIYRVTYPNATDPALAMEEFLVIQVPESEFRDWQLIRIAGEPYPAP